MTVDVTALRLFLWLALPILTGRQKENAPGHETGAQVGGRTGLIPSRVFPPNGTALLSDLLSLGCNREDTGTRLSGSAYRTVRSSRLWTG